MRVDRKDKYFEFNGKYYGKGTIVKFKQHHLQNHHKGECYYGQYLSGQNYNGLHSFLLGNNATSFRGCGTTILDENNNEIYSEIEEIILPHEVEYFPIKKRKYAIYDWEDGELMMWWVIYIIVMFISSIFVCRIFFWAVASFIFWGCRHEKLKEYGYK